MARRWLKELVPDVPEQASALLDPDQGALEAPIRSEIFGAARFRQHGASLAEIHEARAGDSSATLFFPRLRENVEVLRAAHAYIGRHMATGYHVTPAGEWLLDNFHVVVAQLKEVREGLPMSYFRDLPILVGPDQLHLPRVYGVAWAFVAHTDSAFNEELLEEFLDAYQAGRDLNLGELWALPTTLRVLLIENLRRVAERVAANNAAREVANLYCDHMETQGALPLDGLYAALSARGVGRAFALQIWQRNQHQHSAVQDHLQIWLARVLPDPAAEQVLQQAEQAGNNLTVSNAIMSLRTLGDADWRGLIGRTSRVMRLMNSSAAFNAEHQGTQDDSLHAIEALARRCRKPEAEVAETVLALMKEARDDVPVKSVAGHWLRGAGRAALRRALGMSFSPVLWLSDRRRRIALPIYLATLALGTLGLVAWVLSHSPSYGAASLPAAAIFLTLLFFPASEVVVAVVNRLISESARPSRLPRLNFSQGITAGHRVVVAIPCMLTDPRTIHGLAHQLELHYLANREPHAQFALLSDWVDADTPEAPEDQPRLDNAIHELAELNRRYPADQGAPQRFLLLHRGRRFSETEQRWIGWERKRGKLEALTAAIATGEWTSFLDLGELSQVEPSTKYVLALDSDTALPPDRLRDLVGVAAHPYNRPVIDAARRKVVDGYAILQPHVATPLPDPAEVTAFHWLFAGQCGIDPYSAATSEVYQDLFGEGTFTGKGLLHVHAMHAALSGRLPDESVLSHDLLEGCLARCGSVSDVSVLEDAPGHAGVAAARVHRWTRGDWQLLPFLARAGRFDISVINRWKMLDNLRRSLVAPASLALLVWSLATGILAPSAASVLIFAALCAGPMMGAAAGLAPSRDDMALAYFYRRAFTDIGRAICIGLYGMAQLMEQALMLGDAIVRAVYRLAVSRRHLLQWTTAAAVQASASIELGKLWRKHAHVSAAALVLLGTLLATGTRWPALAVTLCLAWALSPVVIWLVSQNFAPRAAQRVESDDAAYLRDVARDTWRLFEYHVGALDHHLPPDNLQIDPYAAVAHRSSPTNIGLYLLSICCARQFGWIGTEAMLARLEATLVTLERLTRYRGHFLNWYDTRTLAPLAPQYVSAVDSGNLCGHLLATAQACLELAANPYGRTAFPAALEAARARIDANTLDGAGLGRTSACAYVLDVADPIEWLHVDTPRARELLLAARLELDTLPHADGEFLGAAPIELLSMGDYVATLLALCDDSDAADVDGGAAGERLRRLANEFQRLAWEPEFGFLFDRKRRLMHIGFRVADEQTDTSFYDLLASESRLTSLIAIARGDVPVNHWAALGRPFYALGFRASLRSWSGSMFEYLMPSLTLAEPPASVLGHATRSAVQEQMDYGRLTETPWGISESAYAGRDHSLAYQYAPQGVPRLALRRTPPDELVIAPYATMLALSVEPAAAVANLRALEELGARQTYGFVEAVDYSRARQQGEQRYTLVQAFMAHHQGMSIVAIANLLLERSPRQWGMADSRIEAMMPLLQERAPREVSVLLKPPALPRAERRAHVGIRLEVKPRETALLPTQLLSNGNYTVSLRANGAGVSQRGSHGISRWRDDALRDTGGTFFFLHRRGAAAPHVSLTQHPAGDPAARYRGVHYADRAAFEAEWPDLRSHCIVWVSPEDDIELRQIELHNLSDEPLELGLASYFEAALSHARADESHPAFSNLFVRARWDADTRALFLERKPRLATEAGLHAVHFIADSDATLSEPKAQADRRKWMGRNHDLSDPHVGMHESLGPGATELVTGLDPIASIAVTIHLPPQGRARITYATGAADSETTLQALVDKYRHRLNVERSSLMSATLASIRMREMRLGAEALTAILRLTTPLAQVLSRPARTRRPAEDNGDRRQLWRFGISGDRPILLVTAGVTQGIDMLATLAQALRIWSWAGLGFDLVVINVEPASYLNPVQRELAALRDRFLAETESAPARDRVCAFHLLRATEISAEELATLKMLARVRLNADGRPLAHHVQDLADWHEGMRMEREDRRQLVVPHRQPMPHIPAGTAPNGEFDAASGEFRFIVDRARRPMRPWINVLSNPHFGMQLSEAGAQFTWARNSRLNQLTPWSNDPVCDGTGEWLLFQDPRTRRVWSVGPSGVGGAASVYGVRHGQGYSLIRHVLGEFEIEATWCVAPDGAVKQVRVAVTNRGGQSRELRMLFLAEWLMGSMRADRLSTQTAAETLAFAPASSHPPVDVLYCTQRDGHAGFGGGTAFLTARDGRDMRGARREWTCDRREFFDADGQLIFPDTLARQAGNGLDPCAGIVASFNLPANGTAEQVFLMGYADDAPAARLLAREALTISPADRQARAQEGWRQKLDALHVETPDPAFDALVNHWLLYQVVACRLWARAGFYQAGGAFGFRDQLQDAMALAFADPGALRSQILLNASRQFPQGDVQHWWHSPLGAGVRTHFSDDLLWLPYACAYYVAVTRDEAILDEEIPFIDGPAIPDGAEDAYYVPTVSALAENLYEHCARAIDHSLTTGAHGLPLIGTGDWNDGMNRVGHEGRGESVWLAWFLCRVIADFAPLARARGEASRAARWEEAVRDWKAALDGEAWDGRWYKRAFFDDGSPLGSATNTECRIDLIAQAWSVLSGAAPPVKRATAMESADRHLIDHEHGLVKLLTPPLVNATPSAGYIQAYPPGVRENGGQYSHGGVWALMAHAAMGEPDEAWRLFTYLSPAHRALDTARATAYELEPYVMAGDIYTEEPYVGRGGWSWYTGSAAWMYRAAVESICGLRMAGSEVWFEPALPSHWPMVKLTLRRGGHAHVFLLGDKRESAFVDKARELAARELKRGERMDLGAMDGVFFVATAHQEAAAVDDRSARTAAQ